MFPFSLLVTPFSVFLSLSTATGVVVHDTKIDKATMAVLSVQSPTASAHSMPSIKLGNVTGDWHTHAESHSLSQAVRDLKGANPKVQPRSPSEKKYLSQKNLGLGHNPFDSYTSPLM